MTHQPDTVWTASPLKGVSVGRASEICLGDGLALMRTDERPRSVTRDLHHVLTETRSQDIHRAEWWLVLRTSQAPFGAVNIPHTVELLQDALIAFQIIRPVETYGLTFSGLEAPDDHTLWQHMDDRHWPMRAGQWPRLGDIWRNASWPGNRSAASWKGCASISSSRAGPKANARSKTSKGILCEPRYSH